MFPAHRRLYLLSFIMDFAMMAGSTALPFYIYDHLDGTARMSGVISGLQFGGYALASLISSRFVHKVRNGMILAVIGCAGFGLLFGFAPIAPNAVAFGAMCVASMLFLALIWPAVQARLVAHSDAGVRSRRIGMFNISWSIGLMCGSLVSGRLYDFDNRLPFATLLVIAFVGVALVATVARRPEPEPEAAPPPTPEHAASSRSNEAYLYAAWLANLVGCAFSGISRAVFSERVNDLVEQGQLTVFFERSTDVLAGGAATQFSILVFILNFARMLTFLTMGRTHRWHHSMALLAVSQMLAGLGFVVLVSSHSLAVMAACYALIGINNGVCFFASLYYSLSHAALKHRRAAIHESTVGLGNLLGAAGFGVLAGWYGVTRPLFYIPFLVVPALLLQVWLLRIGRRKTAVPA